MMADEGLGGGDFAHWAVSIELTSSYIGAKVLKFYIAFSKLKGKNVSI